MRAVRGDREARSAADALPVGRRRSAGRPGRSAGALRPDGARRPLGARAAGRARRAGEHRGRGPWEARGPGWSFRARESRVAGRARRSGRSARPAARRILAGTEASESAAADGAGRQIDTLTTRRPLAIPTAVATTIPSGRNASEVKVNGLRPARYPYRRGGGPDSSVSEEGAARQRCLVTEQA